MIAKRARIARSYYMKTRFGLRASCRHGILDAALVAGGESVAAQPAGPWRRRGWARAPCSIYRPRAGSRRCSFFGVAAAGCYGPSVGLIVVRSRLYVARFVSLSLCCVRSPGSFVYCQSTGCLPCARPHPRPPSGPTESCYRINGFMNYKLFAETTLPT